jgi:hypothetical protein
MDHKKAKVDDFLPMLKGQPLFVTVLCVCGLGDAVVFSMMGAHQLG